MKQPSLKLLTNNEKSNFYSLQSELGSKRPAEPSQNCLHRTLQLFRKQEQHYQAADIEKE